MSKFEVIEQLVISTLKRRFDWLSVNGMLVYCDEIYIDSTDKEKYFNMCKKENPVASLMVSDIKDIRIYNISEIIGEYHDR